MSNDGTRSAPSPYAKALADNGIPRQTAHRFQALARGAGCALEQPECASLIVGLKMTLDQQIQIWNAVGTWLAGIATFSAVVVSLHLARKTERVKLRVTVGLDLIFLGDGSPADKHVGFTVVNLGERPVNVVSIGWCVGEGKARRFCYQPVAGRFTERCPKRLAHGEQASFMVSFQAAPNWVREFATGFVEDLSDNNLRTLRARVSTSVGSAIEVRPEANLLEALRYAR
jgi:hypothetical protein